jgi:phosphate transport system permease protein
MTISPPGPPRRAFGEIFGDTPQARRRIARLRRLDALAAWSIRLGGAGIIVAVFAIFFFVVKEAAPLFLPGSIEEDAAVTSVAASEGARALAVGEDEYREKGWTLGSDGRIRLLDFAGSRVEAEMELAGLEGATLTCGARAASDDVAVAAATDGRVFAFGIRYEPTFADGKRSGQTIDVAWQLAFGLREGGMPIDLLAVTSDAGRLVVAGAAPGFLAIASKTRLAKTPKVADATPLLEGKAPTALALDEAGENLIVGFADGTALRLALEQADAEAMERIEVGDSEITALAYAFGSRTLLVGDQSGRISGWQGVRSGAGSTRTLSRVRQFEPMRAPLTAFAPSRRNKTFLAVDRQGDVKLHHITTESTIGSLEASDPAVAATLAPKSDGGRIARADGRIDGFHVESPHPEVTLATLFAPMVYEGYDSAEFVWQSTGGTDDFEPKFSLVPLIFGSLKGVLYAMVFSVPLAILAALYVSQFATNRIRGIVKPTVELMGALPSVVVGFIAGLWLAPLMDRNLAAFFLLAVSLPLSVLVAAAVFRAMSNPQRQRFVLGKELRYSLPFLVAGAAAAILLARPIEKLFFDGDVRTFLVEQLGIAYDPRNSIVVGIALGFAVIPIIFTVAEDAMSNVPRALRAASDALGASRWQTAWRLVLPAASPGIFAAVMLGFGRAVGETMIVLMATGNTPILDLSPFNGMRTISACIAVEMPEAPEGGTLARVLFLAGALLFVFAFFANTAAEVVGERLRRRYARW